MAELLKQKESDHFAMMQKSKSQAANSVGKGKYVSLRALRSTNI